MSDLERWRDRAAEALAEAACTRDEVARWQLVQIAVGYEHLAKRADEKQVELTSRAIEE